MIRSQHRNLIPREEEIKNNLAQTGRLEGAAETSAPRIQSGVAATCLCGETRLDVAAYRFRGSTLPCFKLRCVIDMILALLFFDSVELRMNF